MKTFTVAGAGLAALLGLAPAALAREPGLHGRITPGQAYGRAVPVPGYPVPLHLQRSDVPGPGAIWPVEGNEKQPERLFNYAEPITQSGSGQQTGGYARERLPEVGPLWPFR